MKRIDRSSGATRSRNRLKTWVALAALGVLVNVGCSWGPSNGGSSNGSGTTTTDASVDATSSGSSADGAAGADVDAGDPGDDDDGGSSTGSSHDGGIRDAAPSPLDAAAYGTAGTDTTIVAFDNTLVCFGSGGTGPCSRTVDQQVTFPTKGAFSSVTMHVTLNCPSNGCDPWDRAGSIDLVKEPANDGGAETLIELGRFMTPYGISSGVNSPPAWDIDVTEVRPLLSGTVTLRVFIDTWVPQGNAAQYGGGWVVGTSFVMKGGVAAKNPVVALPIWTWKTNGKEPAGIVYGDPGQPIAKALPPQTVHLPEGPTSWGIRSIITGHGQANLDNCAEFCSKNHSWTVGSKVNQATVFRTDCASFPSNGTYTYSRAGWCPGADVIPWDIDVSSQVKPGETNTITYGVDPYVNTCNAGAPDGGLCTGCSSGESCAYDGSDHTQPFFYVSSVLVGFE